MSILKTIQKTKHAKPITMLLHGGEKVGKSTFCANAHKPIFIQTEDGLNGIDAEAFPLCRSIDDFRKYIKSLHEEDHEYKTLIIDSADWLERLIHEQICKKEGVDNIIRAGGGYGNGYVLALNTWRGIIDYLDMIRRDKQMNIIIICHSTVVTVNDPLHDPYDVATLKLHSPKKGTGAADLIKEWVDIIGYAMKPLFVSGGKPIPDDTTYKGNKLILGNNPSCIAGNRYGLPDELPLDFKAFSAAMKAAKSTNVTQLKTNEAA